MSETWQQYDNTDDRREIQKLLEHLEPIKRMAWLAWCCKHAVLPHSNVRPVVAPGHTGSYQETYYDWWSLLKNYNLDEKKCLAALVYIVRKQ